MIVGLLFISTLAAALATAFGIALGMPVWLGLITFPAVGSATLLVSAAAIYILRSPASPPEANGSDMSREDHVTA
ncbi:hypothetical protein [Celeribacter neptunius]|uniref:Uncharacterized protein n=1 Tax=Celeribacter neptunius TaxID=588602 RepID=A0A1I3TWM6_9RHOB|nr:hypothetical protein [Celeribacter neptunius]SFJ75654.1 hypothetical protein SAMN04487991_2931 [Celeribacter neptunius]